MAVNLIIWTGLFLYLLRLGIAAARTGEETMKLKKNRLYLFGILLLLAFAAFSVLHVQGLDDPLRLL